MRSATHDKTSKAKSLFLEAERCEEKGDFRTAFKHLLAAAELGDSWAQLNLGNFYAAGTGVRRDLDKAAYWYKKAYKNGNNDGALNLAIDKKNHGDVKSAVRWLNKAVAMNNGDAFIELAKIYSTRKDGQKTAANLLQRALRLSRDNISEVAKEQAVSLLQSLQELPARGARR